MEKHVTVRVRLDKTGMMDHRAHVHITGICVTFRVRLRLRLRS